MTFHHHDGSAGPARLSNKLTAEAEFLVLMDLKLRAEQRLDALAEILVPGEIHPSLSGFFGASVDAIRGGAQPVAVQPVTLPCSGLRQAAPGVLLFKGGRNA